MTSAATPENAGNTENASAAYGAPDPDTAEGRSTLRKAITASALGNATEWFDYGVYATLTTYITLNFFPGELGSIGTMLGFAVSFVLRPLGGFIWGPLGDKLGRKTVLATTIVLMAGATFCMGLIPSVDTIGVWAPILLITLRVIQGFSTGGEYGGAATFMAEYAPDRQRGRWGSFLEFGTLAGFAAGSAVVLVLELLLSEDAMAGWGWRLPFFIALPLGLVGFYLRTRLAETPVFQEIESEEKAESSAFGGLKELLARYWRPILTMFAMVIALNVANYTLLTYLPTYLQTTIGLDPSAATATILIGELVMMALIPFSGALSDRVGRKPMWLTSLIGLLVLSIPLFLLMRQGFGWAIVAFAVLGILYLPQLSTISATFPAMFPTQVRYAGFAISYNVATAAFGGTAPLVSDAVIQGTGFDLFPAVYMMAACVIGLIAMPFFKETAGASLRGTQIPETGTLPVLDRR